ncbi:MAG: M23 family metallopeptidase [Rhodothermaceae bacterium]|nr:M23 family metallopeptidase [Rhodothermaceae bacterium]MYG70588.1 M23 family metallopeptidase [Rhodothermaceae bacterium]MYJ44705.1 M23 family metallopeptidase [Rhodothermaceae bacterium]
MGIKNWVSIVWLAVFSKNRMLIGGAWIVLLVSGIVSPRVTAQDDSRISIVLPTDNDAFFQGGGPEFYMGTYRQPRPNEKPGWTAGQYGFVRNVRRTSQGVIYSRFHEGIDIRPLKRTSRGEPLDEIRAIADGEVVYVNERASRSNYGLYIVVEHWWGQSPYYSLYAHLKSIDVSIGDQVDQGAPIGIMGYTGRGVSRNRAHLHLEINLMLSEAFNAWYDDHLKRAAPNHHEIYNGLNLVGIDIASLYLELRENPDLTIPEFLTRETPFFEVTVPLGPTLPDILWRYPWLCDELKDWVPEYGAPIEMGNSWKITFAASGLPIKFEPSDEVVDRPKLNVLQRSSIAYQYLTNGLVRGRGNNFTLSDSGRRRIDLISRSVDDLGNSGW